MARMALSSNPGASRRTTTLVSSDGCIRRREAGGARQDARFATTLAPTVASGGKLGESKAASELESILTARLPRSSCGRECGSNDNVTLG